MKKFCEGCGLKAKPYACVTKLRSGKKLWVCKLCWKLFDYADFMRGT